MKTKKNFKTTHINQKNKISDQILVMSLVFLSLFLVLFKKQKKLRKKKKFKRKTKKSLEKPKTSKVSNLRFYFFIFCCLNVFLFFLICFLLLNFFKKKFFGFSLQILFVFQAFFVFIWKFWFSEFCLVFLSKFVFLKDNDNGNDDNSNNKISQKQRCYQ